MRTEVQEQLGYRLAEVGPHLLKSGLRVRNGRQQLLLGHFWVVT